MDHQTALSFDQSSTAAIERLRAALESRTGRSWDVSRLRLPKLDLLLVSPPRVRHPPDAPYCILENDYDVLAKVFGPYRFHAKSGGHADIPMSDIEHYIKRAENYRE